MQTLHSHTQFVPSLRDCQAAQANATTQAWQRVCLSNRTVKPTDNQADEEEHRTDNIIYTQAGVSCFVGQESSKIKVQFFVGSLGLKIPAYLT